MRIQRQYSGKERGRKVERLIAEECKKRKVSLTELRSGSRRGEIPAVRAEVSRKLVEDYGITIAEIARQVGYPHLPFQRACSQLFQLVNNVPIPQAESSAAERCPSTAGAPPQRPRRSSRRNATPAALPPAQRPRLLATGVKGYRRSERFTHEAARRSRSRSRN